MEHSQHVMNDKILTYYDILCSIKPKSLREPYIASQDVLNAKLTHKTIYLKYIKGQKFLQSLGKQPSDKYSDPKKLLKKIKDKDANTQKVSKEGSSDTKNILVFFV